MPLLTVDNLSELARAARRHLYGHDRKPLSLADLGPRLPNRDVTAWIFGPRNGRYSSLFGVGIYDFSGVNEKAGLSERELVTIEQTFEKYLAKFPAADGFDVVIVLAQKAPATLLELADLDGDGERCARRVWASRKT